MDNAQTDNLVEALARAMRRERNALSDAVDYEISDGAIDLFACACLPVIQSLSAHPAGDVALREALPTRLKPQYPLYTDDIPALARWREDVRQNSGHNMAPVNFNSLGRLLDTIAYLATPAAPTMLMSQEWLDAKNATDPDAECDAATLTERDPIGVQEGICTVPPEGWWCSRTPGHEGPCAARPIEESDAPLTDDENAIIDRAWERHKAAAPTDAGALVDRETLARAIFAADRQDMVERHPDDSFMLWDDPAFAPVKSCWLMKADRILAALRASTGTPAEGEGK